MGRVFLELDGQCFCIEIMAMRSHISHGLVNHLNTGVFVAALQMGEKEELYLFYVEHRDFRGVTLVHREDEPYCRIFFFLGTWRSEVGLETSKYL